ncbi:MAG TPA: tetratricopeptide repeat protein [Microvirga sp.]|nr:tetratricopeptide repeat protein [Microvirga sp.]
MPCRAPQAPAGLPSWRTVAAAGLVALSLAACQKRGRAEITGSIPSPQQATPEAWRRHAELWAPRYEANPADATAALQYAAALRALDQKPQAAAVLQQAALRHPGRPDLLAAYGKVLAEVGRYKEAAEVLGRAHSPERPDWRVLSTQGTVADQTGDHALAQQYYEAALKLVPDEPTVLSNLGLSQALAKRLPEAERTLKRAAELPKADQRVRRNLALVVSLQGRLAEAETILKRDLPPEEAAEVMADLRSLVSQPNSWAALKRADAAAKADGAKSTEPEGGPSTY